MVTLNLYSVFPLSLYIYINVNCNSVSNEINLSDSAAVESYGRWPPSPLLAGTQLTTHKDLVN